MGDADNGGSEQNYDAFVSLEVLTYRALKGKKLENREMAVRAKLPKNPWL